MNSYKITNRPASDQRTFTVQAGHTILGVTVNGEPATDYSKTLPCEVTFAEALPRGSVVEIEAYAETPVHRSALLDAWKSIFAVHPSDDEDLKDVPSVLFVSTKGTLAGVLVDGTETSIPVGDDALVTSLRFRKITKKGTTCKGIVAMV